MYAYLVTAGEDHEQLRAARATRPATLVVDIEAADEDLSNRRREGAAAFLRQAERSVAGCRVFVRISAFGTGRTAADLEAVMPCAPDGIVLPGAVGRQTVEHLGALLAVLEALHDLPDGGTQIIASVDDAAGALAIPSLAASGSRLRGLTWDDGRLRRDLGLGPGETGRHRSLPEPCRHLRAAIVLAARAAGIPAIDSAYPDLADVDGLAAEVDRARRDGFSAKLVLSAAQAAIIGAAG